MQFHSYSYAFFSILPIVRYAWREMRGKGGAGVIRGLWRHKQKGRDRRQKGKGRGGGGGGRGRLGKKEGQRRDHVELLPWNFCRQENNSRPGGGGLKNRIFSRGCYCEESRREEGFISLLLQPEHLYTKQDDVSRCCSSSLFFSCV